MMLDRDRDMHKSRALTVHADNLALMGIVQSSTIDTRLDGRVYVDMMDLRYKPDLISECKADRHVPSKLTEFTETTFIIGTFDATLFRMRIQALVTSRAVSVLGKPPTFWHPSQGLYS